MSDFFTVIHDGNNYSYKLKDFFTAGVQLATTTTTPIYIGFNKPFNNFFTALDTPNTVTNQFSIKYFNGTAYVPAESGIDETYGLTKDGYVTFTKPTDWKRSTVEGEEKYFIEVTPSVDHDPATVIRGLGILFSCDDDIVAVRSNIVSTHNNGDTWLVKHEQARKEIIQALNNKGYRKVVNADTNNPLVEEGAIFADLTEFDILDPNQLKMAAAYLTLSLIYLDELSDEEGDKWERQGKRYEAKFFEAFNLFYLKIDSDDDGELDDDESNNSTSTGLVWI